MNEIEITHENFGEYFFDVRKFRPREGQILAKYTAVAYLTNSPAKQDLIDVLKMDKKGTQAAMVMKKIHCAKEPDCYRVCREMCEDLMSGMTEQQVLEKDYKFILEAFYYANREYVPDDPHWTTISMLKPNGKNEFTAKINT